LHTAAAAVDIGEPLRRDWKSRSFKTDQGSSFSSACWCVEDETAANTVFTGYGRFGVALYCGCRDKFYRSSAMQARAGEIVPVRQEILHLLHLQMEALDSPWG
jgi:hypothetical protein